MHTYGYTHAETRTLNEVDVGHHRCLHQCVNDFYFAQTTKSDTILRVGCLFINAVFMCKCLRYSSRRIILRCIILTVSTGFWTALFTIIDLIWVGNEPSLGTDD